MANNHILAYQYLLLLPTSVNYLTFFVTCFLIYRMSVTMVPPLMVPITEGLLYELSKT